MLQYLPLWSFENHSYTTIKIARRPVKMTIQASFLFMSLYADSSPSTFGSSSTEIVHVTKKSARAWALIEGRGRYLRLNSVSSTP